MKPELYAGGVGKGRSKYGTQEGEVSTYSKHPEQRKAATMSDFEPKSRKMAPKRRVGKHSSNRPAQDLNPEPATRLLARHVLGLDEIESLPDALVPRAEQLWRQDHFAANVPFTNPMFVPMGQATDIGLLYEAVATVVRRHEALRTRLAVCHDRAVQIVEDWKTRSLEVANVRKEDLTDDRPGRKSAVSEFTQKSIDLYAQDGFQCQAFREEDGHVTLGFLAHGFLSDAWSSQILFREIRAVHSALKDGRPVTLEPVTAQFRDYARFQRRSLDQDLDSHLAYWHGKLKDMPPARLPSDRDRDLGRRGRSYFFIGNETVTRLTALAQANRISLTLVLLAIYQLSIAGWSGQREILSAAYTADRVDPRFRNTFGFLVANMPVCARITPIVTFVDFLREFARNFYGGYAHLSLSCELYDAIFSPEKPFCATVFNFVPLQKNFFDSELHSVPAFEGTIIGPDASRPAIYREIYLGLAQYPNGILGKLFYNADRFAPEGMEVFIQKFRCALNRTVRRPDERLDSLVS